MSSYSQGLPNRLPQRLAFANLPTALWLPIVLCLPIVVLPMFVDIGRYRVPEDIPGWALLFGLPHIIASFQTTIDHEYLIAYRYRTVLTASLILLPLLLISAGFPTLPITVTYISFTIYHTVAQQMGIGLAVAKMRPSACSQILKWSAVTFGLVAYAIYFVGPGLTDGYRSVLANLRNAGELPFIVLATSAGSYLVWQARARTYAAALLTINTLIFLMVPLLMLETRFGIIGLMIIRVVHDVSGFVVYVAHDISRNREQRRNVLYRAFPFCAVWWLGPVLAIAIAAALNALPEVVDFAKWLLIGLYLSHYYMESFIWRGPTVHRAQVSFAVTH